MEAAEREWLRSNRHHIRIGEDEDGHAFFEFNDYNVYDAMDDYLTEDLEERLGDVWHRRLWDNPTATEANQIIFQDKLVTAAQLQETLDGI